MKNAIKAPKNGQPVFKRPAFVLVGMMRSGSNFVERQLNLLADVRCYGEVFNPAFVGLSHDGGGRPAGFTRESVALRDADEEAFVSKLDQACDRPILGLRLFLDHSPMMTARLLHDPKVAKIVLSRNLLESFVSLQNARTTGVWLTTEKSAAAPDPIEVDVNQLTNYALRQSLFFNDVVNVLHRTGQKFVDVDYGQIKDRDKLNEIARFIGSQHQFNEVVEPISRQSEGSLADRVVDYPRLVEALKRRGLARWMV